MSLATNRRLGFSLACCSIVLVSLAQLLLKNAAAQISDIHSVISAIAQIQITVLAPLSGGLFCYGLSVIVWQRALGELPLSIAYPLLSLSYPLVYIAAVLLPGFTDTLTAQRIGGLLCVFFGVVLLTLQSDNAAVRATDDKQR